jgi:hypothetical protein
MRAWLALGIAAGVGLAFADTGEVEAIPPGTIVYVQAATCPDGWEEAFELRGRLVVGTTATNAPGDTHGEPLEAGEDRVHGHAVSGTATLSSRSVALASGCCNESIGAHGTHAVVGTAEPVSSGLPTVALRACRRP